jgi:hypothetical protein
MGFLGYIAAVLIMIGFVLFGGYPLNILAGLLLLALATPLIPILWPTSYRAPWLRKQPGGEAMSPPDEDDDRPRDLGRRTDDAQAPAEPETESESPEDESPSNVVPLHRRDAAS